jgi:hypothetical protein
LNVTFAVHALQDGTSRPKVKTIPVPNAQVKVFSTADPCVGNIFQSLNPKKWGTIFDGADGVGGLPGCPALSYGTYQATGTTDVNGVTTIIVPPLAVNMTTQYLVIARATNFDYIQTATSPDPLYSNYPVISVAAGTVKNVPLKLLATFGGKIVPGAQTEFFGSYLNIVQPEYLEWTDKQEQYPFVMVAEGDWSLTTSVTPPEGFVPDASQLSANVADTTSAVQFTMTDVGSDWTQTTVNHTIMHLGDTKSASSTIPMVDKMATLAKNDSYKVMHDSSATVLSVMANDRVNHLRKPMTITAITAALNGTATLAGDALTVSYTPNPGYTGVDTFTYTITDAIGGTSTATVSVTVLAKPEVSVNNASLREGDSGTSPVTVNIKLSNPSLDPVTVNYQTFDADALAGVDYVATSGSVTFAPNVTTMPITVQVIGDTLAEFNEKFIVRVVSVSDNAAIAANADGYVTILDDDPPEISIAPTATITEGDYGTDNVAITVTLSQPHDVSVWVSYVTSPGTALAGSDYIHTSGTIQFLPGTTTKKIYVPIIYDLVHEDTEYFYVDLNTPLNGTLTAASRATVTIIDNDRDLPEISIAPAASITEGNTGSTNVALAVTMSHTHTESVWVNYATAPGTASAGSDYIHTTGTLQFTPGTLTKTIYVPVLGDTIGEPNEMFYVDLSAPLNATLAAASRATVTIVNDDSSTQVFSTTADLAAGTLAPGADLSETTDGEITLAPSQGSEFFGASLPAGWTGTVLAAGGAATVANGRLGINGAVLTAPTMVAVGQTLEFNATFSAPNQSIGFGTTDALVSPMAMFIVRGSDLYARTIQGARTMETLMAGINWLNIPHRYQITTTAQNANYYVDGTLMISHTSMAWGTATMRPVVIDSTVGDGALAVDWMRLTPYALSGTYTSAMFDAGATVLWQKLTSTSTIPSGSTSTITYRSGNTPTPDDGTWTAFTALGTGGVLSGSSRYVQFRIQMTSTTGAKAPVIQDVTVQFKR